jgi:integrase
VTRRRGSGEGNIYQRTDGRWAARLSLGYRDGKRDRRSLYGETRGEVADKLRLAIQAQRDGVLAAPSRLTVDQFLASWLEDVARVRLRPRTYCSYVQVVRLHVSPHLGRLPLRTLSPHALQKWINALHGGGLGARTCQYARAILRSALSQALRWGHVTRNAASLIEIPRVPRHEITPLRPDQARAVLAVAREHRLGALFTVALALGLRQGEALGLRWGAVSFTARQIEVRSALQRVGGQWRFVEPKSARSRRTVALPRVVVVALRAQRLRQRRERLLAGAAWREHDLVFSTRVGTPIEASNLTKTFRTVLARAEVPRVRFHDLRHTAATFLLAQGVDSRTIMETLGHSQISLTLNTYAHVLPSLQKDAAEKMDRLLRPEPRADGTGRRQPRT